MSICLLVIDSSEYVQYGIRVHMEKDPEIELCDIVGTLKEGILSCHIKCPDIVLIDLALPCFDTQNVSDAIRQIKIISPSTRIVFWSDIEEVELLADIILSGTDGYLPRNRSAEDLNKVLKQVHQGIVVIYTQLSSSSIANYIQSIWPHKGFDIPRFSNREWQILNALNHGHSNNQIADTIGIEVSTVSVFVSRIIKKLNVHNRLQAVIQAQKLGLIQSPMQSSDY